MYKLLLEHKVDYKKRYPFTLGVNIIYPGVLMVFSCSQFILTYFVSKTESEGSVKKKEQNPRYVIYS